MFYYFETYIDLAGEHRWRFVYEFLKDREILADSGEGYETYEEMLKDLTRVKINAGSAPAKTGSR